jgi:PEP-CTERM motif-containing protein
MLTNARRVAVALATGCAIFGLHIGGAAAQVVTITVDERGHGTAVNGSQTFPLPFSNQQDTFAGGLPNALTYGLLGPTGLVVGDLVLNDGDGALSEVIRFNQTSTFGPALVFYSDSTLGDSALADTGFPGALYPAASRVIATEVGLEGNNGFLYTPLLTQPGFVPNFAVTYVIISDSPAVPEPGSLALLAIGVGLLGLSRRRQKAQGES